MHISEHKQFKFWVIFWVCPLYSLDTGGPVYGTSDEAGTGWNHPIVDIHRKQRIHFPADCLLFITYYTNVNSLKHLRICLLFITYHTKVNSLKHLRIYLFWKENFFCDSFAKNDIYKSKQAQSEPWINSKKLHFHLNRH